MKITPYCTPPYLIVIAFREKGQLNRGGAKFEESRGKKVAPLRGARFALF